MVDVLGRKDEKWSAQAGCSQAETEAAATRQSWCDQNMDINYKKDYVYSYRLSDGSHDLTQY